MAPLIAALRNTLGDGELPPAFVAQAISLPTEQDIAREIARDVDPDAIFAARTSIRREVSAQLHDLLLSTYRRLDIHQPFSPDAKSAGRRALKNACLTLLMPRADETAFALASAQFANADNMTDRIGALAAIAPYEVPARAAIFEDFYQRFRNDPLVVDKWFIAQAAIPERETLARVKELTRHEAFTFKNPNRVRALIGTFASANLTQFNRLDGQGYYFVIETALALDPQNPQLAARLMGAFKTWRSMEAERRARAEAALKRAAAVKNLSRDLADIVDRCLAAPPEA